VVSSFKEIVHPLLKWARIQKLRFFSSHNLEDPNPLHNRLYHSIRISFLAYKLSRLFKLDPVSCTRAGLLHDIGYATVTPKFTRTHFFDHAAAGYQLLKKSNEPKQILEAVRTHMFPMSPPPRTLFAFVIWLADKLDWVFYILKLSHLLERRLQRHLKLPSLPIQ